MAFTNKMKAVRIHQYGGPDNLVYEDVPVPQPGPDELIVRVHAAGVNPVDWKVREGMLSERLEHRLPLTLGWDLSGTVVRVGEGVSDLDVGDDVFGRPDIARNGCYAEFVVARRRELAKKPERLNHLEAATVPLSALTAWQVLFEAPRPYVSAALQKGQRVLIHAGAGGVGTLAVQLAKWRGAEVIATASADNRDFLHQLGADQVIDYRREAFEQVASHVDVVFDTIGGDTQARSWKVLKPGGIMVSIVSQPSEEQARAREARAGYVFVQTLKTQLEGIRELIDSGELRPVLTDVYPLREAGRAQDRSQEGHVRGKLVLAPEPAVA